MATYPLKLKGVRLLFLFSLYSSSILGISTSVLSPKIISYQEPSNPTKIQLVDTQLFGREFYVESKW